MVKDHYAKLGFNKIEEAEDGSSLSVLEIHDAQMSPTFIAIEEATCQTGSAGANCDASQHRVTAARGFSQGTTNSLANWAALILPNPISTNQPQSGPNYPVAYQVNVHVDGASDGVTVGNSWQTNLSGKGTIVGPDGHVVGGETFVSDDLTEDVYLAIANESGLYNTRMGSISNHWGYLAQVTTNGPIANYVGYQTQYRSASGLIGLWIDFNCNPNPNGDGRFGSYCLSNADPEKQIVTQGQVLNSTGSELTPAAFSGPRPGATKYYFGIDRGAAGETVTGGHTNALWAPVFFPARLAFSRIGFQITVAAPRGTWSMALYKAPNGVPSGKPIYAWTGGSTSFTGIVEETGAYKLDAGLYMIGLIASDDSAGFLAYRERHAFELWPPTSPAGADVTPVSAGLTSFDANPAIATISNGALLPALWVR